METRFSEEWENEIAMIKRKDLGDIFANEIAQAHTAAKLCDGQLADMVLDLLLCFSSSVMDEIFKDEQKEE